jgi:hypothetical protein
MVFHWLTEKRLSNDRVGYLITRPSLHCIYFLFRRVVATCSHNTVAKSYVSLMFGRCIDYIAFITRHDYDQRQSTFFNVP